jgi:putative transposase
MDFDDSSPHRRNLRLPEFDYSQPGAYFVTIVTQDRKLLFGDVFNGEIILNEAGRMVTELWLAIPEHFSNVELGEFVVMPNHIHGIITITNLGATHASPLPRMSNGPKPGSIGAIVGSFKSATSKRFHDLTNRRDLHLWQRNYYEHVIRNERDHQAIYDYIVANPENWEKDDDYAQV